MYTLMYARRLRLSVIIRFKVSKFTCTNVILRPSTAIDLSFFLKNTVFILLVFTGYKIYKNCTCILYLYMDLEKTVIFLCIISNGNS